MTFNEIDLKMRGRNIHRFLTKESYKLFKDKGYKVKIEYRLPNNKIADIYAQKNKEKIVVECLVKPSLNYVLKKRKRYEGYKLVIAYPSNFIPTFPIEDFVDQVIKINIPQELIDTMIKNYSISLKKDIVKKTKEIIKPQGGKLSTLINEFLKKFNEENEVKENGNK